MTPPRPVPPRSYSPHLRMLLFRVEALDPLTKEYDVIHISEMDNGKSEGAYATDSENEDDEEKEQKEVIIPLVSVMAVVCHSF
ncbi:hypothetical protein E2C01_015354 [Portunus trituberculatus]|uniref:Uncharacterized protein n=1 Tax=Portunus trituberculatus TaxID=210409 RepID=A0A5B7DLB1_PORTR|nr:hypothetical protein [Portunus trituberculatus]